MEDQKLKDYFKFDEDDLQANRNGDFSEKQKREQSSQGTNTVQRRRRAAAIFFALGIVLFLMGFLIFIGVGNLAQNGGLVICPGLGGGAFLLASIYIFRSSFSIQQNFQLKKAEGPINIIKAERTKNDSVTHNTERYVTYELHIGGISFDVLPDLADIMMQGDVYAVYYMEGNDDFSSRIWSAEFVSKAK
jgi:hypothetical protein